VIATLNNTAATTVTETLEALFAEMDLRVPATEAELVINELDRWRNPDNAVADFCAPSFNLVVVSTPSTHTDR
jgi:hypothetical protein